MFCVTTGDRFPVTTGDRFPVAVICSLAYRYFW